MSRLNWNHRQGPDDFDQTAPQPERFDFDHRRNTTPGSKSWPDKFGPSSVTKAWKAGLVVVAEIEGFPHPVAVTESKWSAQGVLAVKVNGSYVIPNRIWTRDTVKGLDSTGLLIEE